MPTGSGCAPRDGNAMAIAIDITIGKMSVGAAGIHGNRLVPGSVTGNEIADGSILAAEIGAQQVVGGVWGVNSKISPGTITTQDIQDRGILGGDLAVGTVTNVEIADGTITNNEIGVGAIHGNRITPGTLSTTELAAGTIDSGDLAAGATSAVAWRISNAPFAFTQPAGGNTWVFDSASMAVTITLPVDGWVLVHATGSFRTDQQGNAAFGIRRSNGAAVPVNPVVQYFYGNIWESAVSVQLVENLAAGTYTYYFGMGSYPPGMTVTAGGNYRSIVAQALYR